MIDKETSIERLFDKVESYGKTSMELFKLSAIDKSADIIASLAVKLVLTTVVALLILCLSVGLALWIGEALGKVYYGFFVLGVGYASLTIFIYAFYPRWIKRPVSNAIIVIMKQKKV